MSLPDLLPDMPSLTDEQMAEIQAIHFAAGAFDIPALRPLLHNRDDANITDPTTLKTPLHTAILAYTPPKKIANGHGDKADEESKEEPDEELAKLIKVVKYLLQNGAVWNALDANNDTPGCIADEKGLKEIYEIMIDAGVRAEMLLNTLEGYEPLGDQDEDEEMEDIEVKAEKTTETKDETKEESETAAESKEQGESSKEPEESERDVNSTNYLSSTLQITPSRILDEDKNGVMMSWETPLMSKTAALLLPTPGLRVLNVGFGMGIIDSFFQSHSPKEHHIVEAHPDVLAKIKSEKWAEKPGVTIHEGKWQEVIPKLVEQGLEFDAIYFDTFAEPYTALRYFFSECVTALLPPPGSGNTEDGKGGRWSFFNGLGADRKICYDVYTKVVEMDIFEAGFETEWIEIKVEDLDEKEEWKGVKRKYWDLDVYRLPVCRWMD
jgi:protein arginine N-methyltransferase 2